jgi:hypothetical protein
LIGRWVQTEQGSAACTDGPFDDYDRSGRYSNGTMQGRWRLEAQTLSIIGSARTASTTVTAATMGTMTLQPTEGLATEYRRCAKNEVQPTAEPADPVQPSQPDLTRDLENFEAQGGGTEQ